MVVPRFVCRCTLHALPATAAAHGSCRTATRAVVDAAAREGTTMRTWRPVATRLGAGGNVKATARLRQFSMGVSAVQARGEAYERRSPPRMTALNEKEQEEGSLPGRLITGTNHTTVLRIARVVPMIQQHRQSRYDMRANTCDDAQLQPAWPAGHRAPAWRARLVAAHALAMDYYPFRAFRAFTSAD